MIALLSISSTRSIVCSAHTAQSSCILNATAKEDILPAEIRTAAVAYSCCYCTDIEISQRAAHTALYPHEYMRHTTTLHSRRICTAFAAVCHTSTITTTTTVKVNSNCVCSVFVVHSVYTYNSVELRLPAYSVAWII